MTAALWIVQSLLALLFLFAGGMKLVLPLEKLTAAIIGWLMRGFENILPGDAWNKPLPS